MTPEAQRIAIESVIKGQQFYFENGQFYRWHTDTCPQPFNRIGPEGTGWLVRVELPSYLTDLNACHEMEKVLSPDDYLSFGKMLVSVCMTRPENGRCRPLSATAAQRCEAFLKTLSLWTE